MAPVDRKTATVYVVDDDVAVRHSLERLMRSVGLRVETFESAAEFLAASLTHPACLVLDLRMPEIDGLASWSRAPVIFLGEYRMGGV